MAGNTSYKLGIVISADASAVKPATKEAQTEIAAIGTVAEVTESKMQRLIATATGLHSGAANGNQRDWLGALSAEGMALDKLRQKYNPMFAVIREYKAAQTEIRTAHAMGALSADEMTAAMQRQRQAALASIDAIKGRNNALQAANGNGHNMAATNAMFQFQDIGMTAAMGMNPAMIAMQQGSQLAGGFSGMSLKQAGASVLGGFSMLFSPVSLATVALTGLTAAAIQYAMKWAGNAKTLSETIEEHEGQIKSLRAAYEYAGTGADEYYQRINSGQRFMSMGSRKELERTIKSDSQKMLGGLGRQTSGSLMQDAYGFIPDDAPWVVYDGFKEFETAIQHLRKTAAEGKPDILGFRQMVEERWGLDENNKQLSETAKKLLELGPNAVAASLALEKFSAAEAKARNAVEASKRRSSTYADSISGLQGIAAPQLSERRQTENEYATAYGNAGDRDERADALRQRDEALTRINAQEQRQNELSQIDIQLQTARDPLTRAELAAQRERIELQGMDISASEAQNRINQARNQSIAESLAQSTAQISDMRSEIEARRAVTDAIQSGTISSADAQTYLEAESQLRPLIAAAARAEGEEKQKLIGIIDEMRAGYSALAAEQKRATAISMLEGQKEQADELRLELSLVNAGEVARRRALSSLQAEQELKRQGISTESQLGQQYKRNAEMMTEARITLERQTDAWSRYQSAGENAIDSIFDALGNGDYKDALKNIGLELTKTFTDLAVKNPLKNALFGSNYGTLDDLLSGKSSSGNLLSGIFGGQSVSAMNVQAAVVNVGGVGIGGADGLASNITRLLNPANSNLAGGNISIANAAAAIKSIESAGSGGYGALGPVLASGDRAYGAYQIMGSNIGPWTKSALGQSMSASDFLASPSAQDAVFSKVFGGYVGKYGMNGAAQAWFGGPGSVGKSVSDTLGTTSTDYVNKFNNALSQVSSTAGGTAKTLTSFTGSIGNAGNGLNQLGSGFNSVGQQLSNAAAGGGGGGFNLLSIFPGLSGIQSPMAWKALSSGAVGLFDRGGYTGPGAVDDPAGIVHAGEIVWSQRDIARAGGIHVVEGMRLGRRGYVVGGIVNGGPTPFAGFSSPANTNGSAASTGRPNLTVHQDLRGASGENAKQQAYEGMMQALEEYDAQLPDRVQEINHRPRWRG